MKSACLKSWTAIAAILIAITPAYATPSLLDNILSSIDSPPDITTAYLDKTKYQPGDQMLITAAVSDDWGIKKVHAEVENEKGYEAVDMILITGNTRKGTWQGAWKVQDTVGVKEYKTKITATDLSGQTAEKILLWIDPVQSHPSEQIRAGAFQSGNYKFPDGLGIGADAAASDKLKVVKTSTGGNAINSNCATGTGSCDAVYAVSDGGIGVKGTSTSNYGVYGKTTSGDSGVVGFNDGSGNGVGGASTSGYGIYGRTSSSGSAGVLGDGTWIGTATGVKGTSVSNYGVYGYTKSGDSGVVGFNDGTGNGVGGSSTSGYGIYGRTTSGNAGVRGEGSGTSTGVSGNSVSGYGVYGHTTSGDSGVVGFNDGSGNGVGGASTSGYGVYGRTSSSGSAGVAGDGGSGKGVYGQSTGNTGVYGASTSGNGVLGTSDSATGVWGGSQTGNGVYGSTNGNGASGVFGNNGGAGNGVAGISNTGTGIYGKSTSGYSGYFEGGNGVKTVGNMEVTGQVKITGGSPGAGKILASDANGLASWQTPAGSAGVQNPKCGWGSNVYYNNYWGSAPTVGSCSPPACSAGYTDLGTGCSATGVAVRGGTSEVDLKSVGYCERYCVPSTTAYQPKCGWGSNVHYNNYWGSAPTVGSCSPPACSAGYTDLGTGCSATGVAERGGTSEVDLKSVGYCERYCV